jgi:DNA-binding NarL/FixJ family response regulator
MKTRTRARMRVLLAHSNLMTARLLSQALEINPDMSVVSCVTELNDLVTQLETLRPDVLVASTHLADLAANRFATLRSIITGFASVPCILLLDRSTPEVVVDAFRAGVKGVFSCSEGDTKQLEKCIQRVAEGQIWADTAQLHYIVSALPTARLPEPRQRKSSNPLLTPREEQVVRLVAEGMNNRDIAVQMQLSENTVKNYLFKIFEKLGFSNRVELVLYATANGNFATVTTEEPATASAVSAG